MDQKSDFKLKKSGKTRFFNDCTFSVAKTFYKKLDTPKSLTCYLLLINEEWEQLASQSVNPLDYIDGEAFADDYAAVSLLKKYEAFPCILKFPVLTNVRVGFPYIGFGRKISKVKHDKARTALHSAVAAERQCTLTNRRLQTQLPDEEVYSVLDRAYGLVRKVLGTEVPTISDLIDRFGIKFGPGSTLSCSSTKTTVFDKLELDTDCTIEALPFVKELLQAVPRLSPGANEQLNEVVSLRANMLQAKPLKVHVAYRIVQGDKWITVPKTALTDRPIAIQPGMNMLLQKLFGSYIRERMKTVLGIDLDDQHFKNRLFAKRGSMDGELATIDLQSASDTISTSFVKSLLTESWFTQLERLRCRYTNYTGDEWFENRKFSAMGNGYTFELESLLFYALISGVRSYTANVLKCRQNELGDISIFGDDVIIPTLCVPLLEKVFDYCGFSINTSKSFSTGNFRESCGFDFWLGQNIRPVFIKEPIDHVERIYSVANSIRHYAGRRGLNCFCSNRFLPVWRNLLSRLEEDEFLFGPSDLGDTVIWGEESDFGIISEYTEYATFPTSTYGICFVKTRALQSKRFSVGSKRRALTGILYHYQEERTDRLFEFNRMIAKELHEFGAPEPAFLQVIDNPIVQNTYRGTIKSYKIRSVAVNIRSDALSWL